MSPGPTLADVAIPLCELQVGLTRDTAASTRKTISYRARGGGFVYDRREIKRPSFVYFLFDNTDVKYINHLNAQLNPICHLLALLGAHHILHVSRIRVNTRH